ncbi:MAG: EthD family reductase [Candidatus Obscuribacterales bacterium]|jgi:uncharacterized protein (TIGR02118 family)|nr:EthD family reductase [Candidatus Obscuribacterales bacterium]
MTAKLIALYKPPADAKDFDSKYFDEHIPLAQKIPGLQLIEISKVTGAPTGDAPYYLMTELYFDNMEAVKAGLDSPEGRTAGKNLLSFAGDLVTMMYAEVADNN